MKKIVKENAKLEKFTLPRAEALEFMKDEPYKVELINDLPADAEISFYRTKAGAEIDFVVARGGRTVAVECKASTDPSVGRGNTDALDDIRPDRAFVAAPVESSYPLNPRWTVVSPGDLGRLFDPDFLR